MKRRDFIKDGMLAAAALAGSPVYAAADDFLERKSRHREESPSAGFHFKEDGTFKLLQLTDTHHIAGDPRSERSRRLIPWILDTERPDLVIHTGDIFYSEDIRASLQEVFGPLAARNIPFAAVLGNHDAQFGMTREEVMEEIRRISGCVNGRPDKGINGASNDVLTLSGPDGIERVFYLLDSGDNVTFPGFPERFRYDYIHRDQIEWYREWSRKLGRVPATMFFHIPLREIAEGLISEERTLVGTAGEFPCPADKNSGLLLAAMECGDVDSFVYGHDHDCDYVLLHDGMLHIYGRYSGGNTEYNHLGAGGMTDPDAPQNADPPGEDHRLSGARVFEFRSGELEFRTWIRLWGGQVIHPLTLSRGKIVQDQRFL